MFFLWGVILITGNERWHARVGRGVPAGARSGAVSRRAVLRWHPVPVPAVAVRCPLPSAPCQSAVVPLQNRAGWDRTQPTNDPDYPGG